jgi:hypothetical protein
MLFGETQQISHLDGFPTHRGLWKVTDGGGVDAHAELSRPTAGTKHQVARTRLANELFEDDCLSCQSSLTSYRRSVAEELPPA